MRILFPYKNEDEKKELCTIITAEVKRHFGGRMIDLFDNYSNHGDNNFMCLHICDKDFFDDIQKARELLYTSSESLLPDFLSDVEENLSFVSTPECA